MRADRNISGFADLHGVSAEVSGFMDTIMALQPQERDPLLNALGAKVNLVVPRFGRHNPFMSAQIKGAFDFLIRSTKEDIQTARDISIQLSTSKQPAYEQFPRSFFDDEVIKLTNSGTAIIDAGYTLRKLDDRSPENLAVMYGVSPIYPEILEFKEEQAAMRATHEEMQLVLSQIEEIPLKPVMTSGNSIGKINFLISRALNTIAKLPPQDRVTLVTELRDRINLIVPTYSGYDYSILTTAFNGIRDSFVPKIQTAIDFASEQTKRLQLLQLLTYKDLMPEVFQVKSLPEATDALKPFLSKVALSETKDFVEKPEARVYPDIASYNGIAGKIQASKLKLSCEGREYIDGIDPAIVSINGLVLKVAASRYKEISENPLIVPEQLLSIPVEVTSAEQQFTRQPQEQVEFLQQVSAFKKTIAEIPQIKLQVLNQASGQLTLKSGRFEFVGNNALVNDGAIIQANAYTLWLTSVPGEFNRGTRKVNGSLGLLSLNGSDLGNLQVEDVLHVDTNSEALKALVGLSKVQARRVILQAPTLQKFPESLERKTKTCPWPLELNIAGAIDNNVDISAPELKVKAQSLKTSGNLFSTQAVLELSVAEGAEIFASIGGRAGINLSAKKLKLLGRADIPGAVRPNVCYKRNDNGLYAQGPVVLNIAELLDNRYGVIQGSSYTIKAPQLINLAGLITATDPSLSSTINVKEIKNLRDEARGYTTYSRQQRIYYADGKDWCGCHGTRVHYCCNGAMMNIPIANSYETSDEGVIFAQGDLTLNYHQLEMLASRITSGGKLTLVSGERILAYQNSPDIKVLPGTTTMTVRNLHGNHVVAKQDLHVELGNANMATSMQGQNIFVNAGMLTLQSLGVQHKSQGKIVNLLSLMQGGVQVDGHTSSNSNIFKTIGSDDGGDYTDLTLPFKHQSLPTSLVILGQDARSQLTQNHGSEGKQGNQGIDLQATMRSLEQAMGSQFYTLYRGINGLGLNIHHFFNATSDFVRGHKDTITQRRSIKSGETEEEVDVQLNPTLTPQDLLNSGILGVFLDFTKNIQGLESTHKALDEVNKTKQKSALMFAVPADHKKNPGINSPGDIALVSKSDLGVFTNVKGKNVKLVSTDGSTTVGSETIRHQFGHNYHDQLIRSRIEAEENLLIQGKTDVVIKAIETHSGVQTDIIAQTGMVLDQSLATVDHTVSYSYDKKSSTTTKVTNVHQNVSSHSSDGKVNIKANTGILQYGVKNSNTNLDAPIILQEDVHDQRMVESQTISLNSGGGWGRFIGIKERKETNFSESISRSKGCHNSGESFIVMAKERFKAVNPTFGAKETHIYAEDANGERSGQIEIDVGTNTNQSQTQSISKGVVWNKSSLKTENHVTHQNPTFEHNVYLHSPNVILERVRGSQGTFDKIISDSEIIFKDVDDIHQSTSKSQKCLAGGAALLTKLAVGIAMMYAMPVGAFGLTGTTSLMVNAGFATLCSDATVCLVENDGDPGKAIKALSKSKIAMNVARSMLTAGLVGEISDVVGLPSTNLELVDYAQKATIQSAVNTVLAVSIDGQNFEKALMQGMTTAALSTATSYLANQIGQSYFDKQLNWLEHKTLHALLGGLSGGVSSKLFGGSFERGAISGALGAVVAEAVAEMIKPDLTNEMISSQEKGLSREEFEKAFMEKAQQSSKWSDFVGAVSAFGMGLDTNIAYQTSNNATENNFLPGILLALTVGSTVYEGYQIQQTYKNEGGEAALKHLGITVVSAVVVGGIATVGFKVGKAVYPSLHEAYKAAVASRPMLASALTALELRLGKIEKYVKDQFNYKEFFAAERLRLEGGIKPKTYKGGKYAEAEDVISRPLLSGEGRVGTYEELLSQRVRGSGLSAHHMPNFKYMEKHGVTHADSVAMAVEHPFPGKGGRHREIHKELVKQDPTLAPRYALAESVARAKEVYRADGVLPEIRLSLLEVIEANKTRFPELFKKVVA